MKGVQQVGGQHSLGNDGLFKIWNFHGWMENRDLLGFSPADLYGCSPYPPMRTIKCGMASRYSMRPKNAAMAAQAVTIQKAGKSVSGWAVWHSRAVVMRGEMGSMWRANR